MFVKLKFLQVSQDALYLPQLQNTSCFMIYEVLLYFMEMVYALEILLTCTY